MDRAFWQAIVDADYAVPAGFTARELMPALLARLGETDPQWRDAFAYGILVRWIDRGLLAGPDLAPQIASLLANLTHEVGSRGTPAVLLRSFSVLMLAAVVYSDNHNQPFLTRETYQEVLDRTLDYLAAERDLRGYVSDLGWVHALAHTADLLDELAISRWATGQDLERILNAIADKLMVTDAPLLFNEDDRLSFAVVSALKRDQLDDGFVAGWAARLGGLVESFGDRAWFDDPARHAAYLNSRQFLRSLYVRLTADALPEFAARTASVVRAALDRY